MKKVVLLVAALVAVSMLTDVAEARGRLRGHFRCHHHGCGASVGHTTNAYPSAVVEPASPALPAPPPSPTR